jgi:NAD(P)-dependent dehydrogenase (short-subunit alcohol dehydrogenase family)
VNREIAGSVVVLTGASSGIGRAAALRFGREGAKLVLAARGRERLDFVAAEVREHGGAATVVPTDVGDEMAVEALAQAAEDEHGRIDTWVNNAGVMAYGTFEDIPPDVFERILTTNLMGQIYGSRAALKRFRAQGEGVLINMSSVWGRVTSPLVSPYVVSKHAVRAFSECLRHELVGEDRIEVATMVPQAVDTPIFEHAGNYTGKALRPVPPLFGPSQIAEGMLKCARDPKLEVNYGRAGRALEVLYAASPRLYRWIAPGLFIGGTFGDEMREPSTGNVFEPIADVRIAGGWRRERRSDLVRALAGAAAATGMVLAGRGSKIKP